MREGGQGRPTSRDKGAELRPCRGAHVGPSTPPGSESGTGVPCSALVPPADGLGKEAAGHFHRTGRHHTTL